MSAQNSLLFYNLPQVPQSSLINPAFRIDCRYFIGFPALGSTHIDIGNTGFSYNNVVSSNGYDLNYLVSNAHGMDYLSLETHLNLLSFGFEWDDFFFSLHVSDKLNMYTGYPKALLELPWYGNANYIGKTANLSRLAVELNYYHEISLGASYKYNDRLQLGANAKLLFGLANTHTAKTDIGFTTNENTYALNFNSKLRQNISFPLQFELDPATGFVNNAQMGQIDYLSMLLNFSNVGTAFDFGFQYKYDDKITLSGSIVDLGFIRYRTDVHNLFHEGEISYNGYTGTNLNTYFEALLEDFQNNYGLNYSQKSYTVFLPTQIYLGASYELNKYIDFGFTNRNQFLPSKLKTSFSLSTTLKPVDNFAFMLSYGMINNGYNNVGAGIQFKLGAFQMHIVSNNVAGIIYPYNARDLNFRFGMNFIFGCKDKKSGKKKSSGKIGRGCYWLRDYGY